MAPALHTAGDCAIRVTTKLRNTREEEDRLTARAKDAKARRIEWAKTLNALEEMNYDEIMPGFHDRVRY